MNSLIILFLSYIIPLKQINLTQYELESIKYLPTYSNKIDIIKDKNNLTKCIAKTDLKINQTIFAFEKSEILSSESCYYPNKTELITNISVFIKEDIITQKKFILTSCLFFIIDNYYNEKALKNIKKKTIDLVKILPLTSYKRAQFTFSNKEVKEYLITARNFDYEESYHLQLVGDLLFDNYISNQTKNSLFGSLFYFVDQHSFFVNNQIIIVPYLDICNIYPHYLKSPNKNYTNSTRIMEFNDKILVKVKRTFLKNEQFLFGYNHSYDNEELFSKNGMYIKNNNYDKHRIMKKYEYENSYMSDKVLKYLRSHHLNPKDFAYSQEKNGHQLLFKFDILKEKISDLNFRFGLFYYSWFKMENNNKNVTFNQTSKLASFFLIKLIYDDCLEIESKMGTHYIDYLFNTQFEDSKKRKKFKEFNLETLNLLHKNIDYLSPHLITVLWKDIMSFKSNYLK